MPYVSPDQRGLTQWQAYEVGEHNAFFHEQYGSITPRTSDELRRPSLLPAATAAAALASLHNHRADFDWDSDPVSALCHVSYPPCADSCAVGCDVRPRFQASLPTPRSLCALHLGAPIHGCRRAILYRNLATTRLAPFACAIPARPLLHLAASPSLHKVQQTTQVVCGTECSQAQARAAEVKGPCAEVEPRTKSVFGRTRSCSAVW